MKECEVELKTKLKASLSTTWKLTMELRTKSNNINKDIDLFWIAKDCHNPNLGACHNFQDGVTNNKYQRKFLEKIWGLCFNFFQMFLKKDYLGENTLNNP